MRVSALICVVTALAVPAFLAGGNLYLAAASACVAVIALFWSTAP